MSLKTWSLLYRSLVFPKVRGLAGNGWTQPAPNRRKQML